MQNRAMLIVFAQLLCLSASLCLVSVAPNALCSPDFEQPVCEDSNGYDAPASYELEPAARAIVEAQQEQIDDLNSQVETLQAANYQTSILMYVFVAVSAFLALMLMFFVMFKRPTPIVRTLR